MKERIVIKDTSDPRRKGFAFTRAVNGPPGSSVTRSGSRYKVQDGRMLVLSELGPISSGLFCLRAILEVATLSEFEITVAVGPAFLWTDIDDDMSVFDRTVEIIKDRLFHDAPDVEVVNESSLHRFG